MVNSARRRGKVGCPYDSGIQEHSAGLPSGLKDTQHPDALMAAWDSDLHESMQEINSASIKASSIAHS
jgi:hypothetical protein